MKVKHLLIVIFLITQICFFGGCSTLTGKWKDPPSVVEKVDIDRYAGTWYEIARYPHSFEKGCVDVTATYTLRDDGKINVLNKCRKDSFDGKEKSANATAWVADPATNAKLKVRFFWPFSAAYWIIDLDPDYQWALVSHPSRKYLWILSRTPKMDDDLYSELLVRLQTRGFDTAMLYKTPQSER
jgi:apolipoprotein D and lipocalin family protein